MQFIQIKAYDYNFCSSFRGCVRQDLTSNSVQLHMLFILVSDQSVKDQKNLLNSTL